MIRRCELDRTLEAVRRSGVHTEIDALLRAGRGGRPRQLPTDVFITGLLLTSAHYKSVSLVNVHKVLTQDIARSAQTQIGTRYTPHGQSLSRPITIRQVRYVLEAIEKCLAHTQGRAPELSDTDRQLRADALQRILDRIVASSLPAHLERPSVLALDGTAIESAAKARKSQRSAAEAGDDHAPDTDLQEGEEVDVDARWGYRTKTYDNKTNQCFGYEAFAFVGVPPVGAHPDVLPKLTWRFALRPAGTDVVEPCLTVLDSLIDDGHKVSELLNDRAFSYKTADRWATPLRERGIDQIFDMHAADRGVRDHEGIRIIDGTPHCPATPDDLVRIDRPRNLNPKPLPARATKAQRILHEADVKAVEDFHEAIAERETWSFRFVGNGKKAGTTRWECPAQAGKRICTNCEFSKNLPSDTPKVENPPAAATKPTCCSQRTVTIPAEALAKTRQKHYWGSPDWISSYSRRTHVEGYFGNLKNANSGDVRRGWIRVVGLVKTSIMTACAIAATNIRLLRAWSARTGDITDPLCAPDPEDHGFEELAPQVAAGGTGNTSPPSAA